MTTQADRKKALITGITGQDGAYLAAFLLASYASNQWLTLLVWWRQVPFGNPDPVLGLDPAP